MANRSPFADFEPLHENSDASPADVNRLTSTADLSPTASPLAPPDLAREPLYMRIMRVATRLPETFTKENLAVECWQAYPHNFGLTTSDGKHWPHSTSVWSKLAGPRGLVLSGNIVQDGARLWVNPAVFDRLSPIRDEHYEAKRLLRTALDVLRVVRTTAQSPQLDARIDEVIAAIDAFGRKRA